MKSFDIAAWDANKTGDEIHKKLFQSTGKAKIQNGKVKKPKKVKKVSSNRKLKGILSNLQQRESSEILSLNNYSPKSKKKGKIAQHPNMNGQQEFAGAIELKVNPTKRKRERKRRKKDDPNLEMKNQLINKNSIKYTANTLSTKLNKKGLQKSTVQKVKLAKQNNNFNESSEVAKISLTTQENEQISKKRKRKRNKIVKATSTPKQSSSFNESTENEKLNQTEEASEQISKKKKRKKRNKHLETSSTLQEESKPDENTSTSKPSKKLSKYKKKLQEFLQKSPTVQDSVVIKKKNSNQTLREKMMERLKAAKFRFLNEQIYTTKGAEAKQLFEQDKEAFKIYHDGYTQQLNKWPLNPLDVIIKKIQKMPQTHIIADFGCGEAKLSKSVKQKVHSFDFVALNDSVTPCDMSKVPLQNDSVDIAVFCLSLMGTNLKDYLLEANRVLKIGGTMLIAEVESRFEDVKMFVKNVEMLGFTCIVRDFSNHLFYFLDFKKVSKTQNKKKLPNISLKPCIYKKR